MKRGMRLGAFFALVALSLSAVAAGPKFVVVSHAPDADPFWNVVKNGIADAGQDFGVTVDYRNPPNGDLADMVHLLDQAAARNYDGVATTIADFDVVRGSVKTIVAKGIPVITFNSGTTKQNEALGGLLHVGQPEYEAGKEAGERAKAAGVKASCASTTMRPIPTRSSGAEGLPKQSALTSRSRPSTPATIRPKWRTKSSRRCTSGQESRLYWHLARRRRYLRCGRSVSSDSRKDLLRDVRPDAGNRQGNRGGHGGVRYRPTALLAGLHPRGIASDHETRENARYRQSDCGSESKSAISTARSDLWSRAAVPARRRRYRAGFCYTQKRRARRKVCRAVPLNCSSPRDQSTEQRGANSFVICHWQQGDRDVSTGSVRGNGLSPASVRRTRQENRRSRLPSRDMGLDET